MISENPFVIHGFVSDDLFCGRDKETKMIIDEIASGNNISLSSRRQMGKTGLILHIFAQRQIKEKYNTFFIDIFDTKNPQDLVLRLSESILGELVPKGRKAIEFFLGCLKTLSPYVKFDITGEPSFGISINDITSPMASLKEIFQYLENSPRPNIVAIDEFQVIGRYKDCDMAASLRTYIQHCHNAGFIFTGSDKGMMDQMFHAENQPFFNSTTPMTLSPLPVSQYRLFAQELFSKGGKNLSADAFDWIYAKFDGFTGYIQKILNKLYFMCPAGGETGVKDAICALNIHLDGMSTYAQDLLADITLKQKMVLLAIAQEKSVKELGAGGFLSKYGLGTPSSAKAAVKGLSERRILILDNGRWCISDKMLQAWLGRYLGMEDDLQSPGRLA